MRLHRGLQLGALLGALAAFPCGAEVTFHGFGQIVAGSTLDDDKPFRVLNYGVDDDVAFKPESLFALQVSAPLASDIDAVAQIVARGADDFEPDFSWAYLRFSLGDHLNLKLGRQRIGFYRYSDYLEVGVAYPFIRPPPAVYFAPFSNGDGLTLSGNYSVGDWSLQPQLQYFEIDQTASYRNSVEIPMRMRHLFGLVLEAGYNEWLLLHGSIHFARFDAPTPPLDPLLAGLEAFGEPDAAAELRVDNDQFVAGSFAFEINQGSVQFIGEYSAFEIRHSYASSPKQYFLCLAYRLDRWTPHLVWGETTISPSMRAANLMDQANPLRPAVVGFLQANQVRDAYASIGLRYDLRSNVALKFDYSRQMSEIDGVPDAELISAGLVFSF